MSSKTRAELRRSKRTDDGLQRRVRALPGVEEAVVGNLVALDDLVAVVSTLVSFL